MKEWTKEIEIDAPIDFVWDLLNGPTENLQKIMPQVIEHNPVIITDEGVGSVYRQKYKEGKRIEEYDVETLEYLNTPDKKKLTVGFTLAKMFEITALYELNRLNESKTLFKYTCTNRPLKSFLKLIMLFASDRVVVQFCERVKSTAEEEFEKSTLISKYFSNRPTILY
ncbi:SRPBCC family protein [Neobacillus pocheonensis]|uniref:SRPBCC family protein n=1 Tax=Neobacillus pocheonensis TaxID=363869 RepID=UPI003D275479